MTGSLRRSAVHCARLFLVHCIRICAVSHSLSAMADLLVRIRFYASFGVLLVCFFLTGNTIYKMFDIVLIRPLNCRFIIYILLRVRTFVCVCEMTRCSD